MNKFLKKVSYPNRSTSFTPTYSINKPYIWKKINATEIME